MNKFAQRTAVWKQFIINDMVERIKSDDNKEPIQKQRDIERIRGMLGERIAIMRMCKTLGISQRQYLRRLVKVHVPKPRKPPRIAKALRTAV